MGRIETKLPALESSYKRVLLTVQGEFMGLRLSEKAWIDYEMVNEVTLDVEADDVCVVGVWSEAGADMIGEEETADASYLSRCAASAVAGHEYALYAANPVPTVKNAC